MAGNRTLPPVSMWRWNQYATPPQWVEFTGGVSEEGITQVQITDGTDDADVEAMDSESDNLDSKKGLVTASGMYGRISGSAVRPAQLDDSTHALKTIEYAHSEVHSGSSFVTCDVQNVNTTTMKWQITTPATTKYAHVIFDIECTGEMSVLVTEGSDRTDGTALVETNRRRVGTPTVATVIITRTPTGGNTDGATTIFSHRSGSTGVGNKTLSGGGARGDNEYILKPNTKYVVAVETFADVYVSFCVDWYEHIDKN